MMAAAVSLLLFSILLFRAYLRAERRDRASSLLENTGAPPRSLDRKRTRWEGWRSILFGSRQRLVFLCACVFILVLARNFLLALLLPLALPAVQRFLRDYRQERRKARMEEQTLELLDSLAQSLRSGLSLQQALEASAEDVGRELWEEVANLLGEIRAGGGLEESLLRAAERAFSPSLRLTFSALGILHGKGGDLPRVLDKLRERVYEGLQARRELHTATSQSRVSGYLVSALPLVFLAIQAAVNPSSLRPLLATPVGNLLASVALLLDGAAFLIIRRMTSPEV
ncbi:MAG: type II secretion system F family protein [Actinomycetota bacterium]